ncbi:hypothetical protein T440DRAFT_535276 [Plenodomus tracheiphilus IPT5]|uniref:Uncharacterized protein n=1 Tax=Plenodomus tracheiphilus IPT5 TaxID=1408161 RepID=A0A6A7BLQ9_9PLEO|nr:hypothetical protein T440DRAFT_535276 [Plenodomus tracheiphilus IPT5]
MTSHTSVQLRVQDITFYLIGGKGKIPDELNKPQAMRWTSWLSKKKDDSFTFFPADTKANVPIGRAIDIYVSSKILDDKDMKKRLLEDDLGFYGFGHRELKNVQGVENYNNLRFLTDYQNLSKFLGQKDGTYSVYFWLPTEKNDWRPVLLVFMPKGTWMNASRFSEGNPDFQFPHESLKELNATTVEDPLNEYFVSQLGLKIPSKGIWR